MPVLLSGFLLPPPQDPAAPALAPVAPDAGSASTPLFRRFCALLI
jgi:hypothetical protein